MISTTLLILFKIIFKIKNILIIFNNLYNNNKNNNINNNLTKTIKNNIIYSINHYHQTILVFKLKISPSKYKKLFYFNQIKTIIFITITIITITNSILIN